MMTRLVLSATIGGVCAIAAACSPRPNQLPKGRAEAPAPVTAFVNVSVVPMDRERVLHGQTVLVRGNRIVAMDVTKRVRVPAGARLIDGRGHFLIPGLADMHMHLRAGDSVAAERSLFLLLANGVTTIRNMDYLPPGGFTNSDGAFALRLRSRAATGQLPSPRIYTSGPWRHDLQHSVVQQIAAYKAQGYDFVKIHDESSVLAESVVVAARTVGIPVLGHIPHGASLESAFKWKFVSIEHLMGYLPALIRDSMSLEDKDALIQERASPDSAFLLSMRQLLDTNRISTLASATRHAGAWNCVTLELQEIMSPATHDDTLAQWPETRNAPARLLTRWKEFRQVHATTQRIVEGPGGSLDILRRLVRALQSAGAGLLSGTDATSGLFAPYLVPGFALHHELVALVHADLTPYQALSTSTRNVAAYFGTLSETGTVAAGKRADLVLLDGNPLIDIRQVDKIAGVMKDGRWFPRSMLAPRVATELSALESGR